MLKKIKVINGYGLKQIKTLQWKTMKFLEITMLKIKFLIFLLSINYNQEKLG